MLTVVCVEWGNYLGRGAEYVDKLKAMVQRHLSLPHAFVCLQPDVGLAGWWNKIELFRPGRFSGRVVYLDLDTVIVGSIDKLAASKGILHLADWGWTKNDYGSGVMVWDAGEHDWIFKLFKPDVPRRFRGDQDWMTHLRDVGADSWPALPKGLCVSYRYVSRPAPPAGASVVCFHGKPKPHELAGGWVPHHWTAVKS